MTNKINDGGAAFARPGFTAEQTESQEGMSLRDWFAGQALAGWVSSDGVVGDTERTRLESAKRCYEFADAMLAVRDAK